MIKQPDEFKGVKVPRSLGQRRILLAQTYNQGYWAGKADEKKAAETVVRTASAERHEKELRTRQQSLQALGQIGEAMAKIAIAIADVTEPRRI